MKAWGKCQNAIAGILCLFILKKKTQKKQTFERSGEILYKILWLKSLFLTESDIKVIKLTGEWDVHMERKKISMIFFR